LPSDPTTAILLRFTEPETAVLPSDIAEGLNDLTGDSGSTPALGLATVGEALLGLGRVFDTDYGLVGDEATSDQTRLLRDVTIEVLAEYDLASASVGDEHVLIARGKSGSAAERTLWGLKLVKINSTTVRLQMFWEETGGGFATVDGRMFQPPSSGYLYLAASRRWISSTSCEVQYIVNDEALELATSIGGDLTEGDGGSVTVGCKGDGSGNYEDFFLGTIDSLRVTEGVRSNEELIAEYRRIAEYLPQGYESVRALAPPAVYSQDPDSVIQRELMVEGDGLGQVRSKIAELGTDGLPDRAWSLLSRWETITGLQPKWGDSYAVRRARIISFLSTVHGYSETSVKLALEEVLDLDSDDIEILNYTNLYEDDFTTAHEDWLQEMAGAGTISISSDQLKLEVATATDAQWEYRNSVFVRQSIDGDMLDDDPSQYAEATVKIVSRTLAQSVMAGLIAYNGVTRDLLIYGHYNDAGTYKLGYRLYSGHSWGAFVAIDDPAPALPTWIRFRFEGNDDWNLNDSQTSADEVVSPTLVGAGLESPTWLGVGLISFIASPTGASEMIFDDWRAWMPNGLRVFNWYAYRDQALSGTPDMPGARFVVEKLKPAETHASAVEVTGLLCNDTESLCDDGPLGA